MAEKFQFPRGGYQVEVLRKEDILNTINNNIIDKDIALDIIRKCEQDAIDYLQKGEWVSIPYIGSIRIPDTVKMFSDKEHQAILKSAEEELDEQKYILFRRSLANEIGKRVKVNRYVDYIVSKFVTANKKLYKRINDKHGEHVAKFLCYTLYNMEEAR